MENNLCIHHDSMAVLNKLDKYFKLKPGSTVDPDMYLGDKPQRIKLRNGVVAWGVSPLKYVYEAVMDTSKYLDPAEASYFQSIIGVMGWMVEIGRIDTAAEVSLLSSHLAYPREGHIEAALHVMDYLKQKHNSRLVFDPTYLKTNETILKDCDWKDFYGDAEEAITPNTPNPCGKDVDLRDKVDSDHAGDEETRLPRTGYLIF